MDDYDKNSKITIWYDINLTTNMVMVSKQQDDYEGIRVLLNVKSFEVEKVSKTF